MRHFLIGSMVIVLLGVVGVYTTHFMRAHAKHERERRLEEVVESVRAGTDHVFVWDAELISMLADDADCVSNLKTIHLETYEIVDRHHSRLGEFSNARVVHCAYFRVAPNVVRYLATMPSLEELTFFSQPISSGSIDLLAQVKGLKRVSFSLMTLPTNTTGRINASRPEIIVAID